MNVKDRRFGKILVGKRPLSSVSNLGKMRFYVKPFVSSPFCDGQMDVRMSTFIDITPF